MALQTRGGSHLLVGAASAWRVAPGEPARLFGGPFSSPAGDVAAEAPPTAQVARWGAGPVLGVGTHGPLAGALLATPEGRLPLLGWRVSGAVVVAAGAGEALALAGFVVRP